MSGQLVPPLALASILDLRRKRGSPCAAREALSCGLPRRLARRRDTFGEHRHSSREVDHRLSRPPFEQRLALHGSGTAASRGGEVLLLVDRVVQAGAVGPALEDLPADQDQVVAGGERPGVDLVLAEFRNYQQGVLPAGPGARSLTEFFASVDEKLEPAAAPAPRTQRSDRDGLNLLTKRAKTLHIGPANFCWFTDPSRALCLKLAGTPTADRPLVGM
ncbi:hypothetical protein [Kitasatospora aureofaciens]|uniref:hypothetical protein n=1 Tax=Kitasatospora aureofaciens TaxID=1894 RepID=UPI0037C83B78